MVGPWARKAADSAVGHDPQQEPSRVRGLESVQVAVLGMTCPGVDHVAGRPGRDLACPRSGARRSTTGTRLPAIP